jgi:outer membrane lipoprotein SlyB
LAAGLTIGINLDNPNPGCGVFSLQYAKSLSALLLLTVLVTPTLAQSTDQGVKVMKGVVSNVENVEAKSDNNSAGGAVAGGVVGYNLGSGRSQTEKRRGAIIGAGVGAAAGAPQTEPGVRYTVTAADGSTVAVVSSDALGIGKGSCVSVEQSADRSTIRTVDQAVCDLEAQTTVPGSQPQPADNADNADNADKCEVAQQQLLDATTAEAVNVASSKVEILCE